MVLAIPADVLEGILDIQKLSSLRLLKLLCSLVARRLRELDDKLAGWFILAGGHSGEPRRGPASGLARSGAPDAARRTFSTSADSGSRRRASASNQPASATPAAGSATAPPPAISAR